MDNIQKKKSNSTTKHPQWSAVVHNKQHHNHQMGRRNQES